MSRYSIGVDLGGTNLRVAAVDESGTLIEKISTNTQVTHGRGAVLDEMCRIIQTLATRFNTRGPLAGVGIGVPGIIDMDSGMLRESPNLPGWANYPVQQEIERRLGTSITLDTNLNTYLAGDTTSSDLQTQAPLQANLNGPSDAFVVKLGTSADLCITCTAPTVSPGVVSAGSQVTFTYTITNVGPDLATNIQFTDNWTGQPLTFVSAGVGVSSGSCSSSGSTASCTIASLQSGSTATVKVVMTVTSAGNFNGGTAAVSSTQSDPLPSNNQTSVGAQATDFAVAVSPANQTIGAAGQTAVYTVTLSPSPSFAASISLSCSSNVPSQAACNFTNSQQFFSFHHFFTPF